MVLKAKLLEEKYMYEVKLEFPWGKGVQNKKKLGAASTQPCTMFCIEHKVLFC